MEHPAAAFGRGRDRGGGAPATVPSVGGPGNILPDLSIPTSVIKGGWHLPQRASKGFLKAEKNPLILLRAIGFTRFLRSPAYFSEAMDAADDYLAGFADREADQTNRDRKSDSSRWVLDRAMVRTDVLCMNLQRRCFSTWISTGSIKAICLFSDASPVTGVEIQGTVAQLVFSDGTMEVFLVPPYPTATQIL